MSNPFSEAESRPFGLQAVSAGIPVGSILPDPLHWYDFTDSSVVYQDQAGTMLVTGNGDPIQHIKDKGSDPADLTSQSAVNNMTWLTNVLGGHAVADITVTGADLLNVATGIHEATTKGSTMMLVCRRTNFAVSGALWASWQNGLNHQMDETIDPDMEQFFRWVFTPPITGINANMGELPNNTWHLQYMSLIHDDDKFFYTSPGPEQVQLLSATGNQAFDSGPSISISETATTKQIAELRFYDRGLDEPERLALRDEASAKYGVLPI